MNARGFGWLNLNKGCRAVSAAILGFVASSICVAKSEQIKFALAAGEAPQTIQEFSRQSGLQVLFEADSVSKYHTSAVQGEYQAPEALNRMLAGSELTFGFVNDRTVAIKTSKDSSFPYSVVGPTRDDATSAATSEDNSEEQQVSESEKYGRNDTTEIPSTAAPKSTHLEQVVITGTHIRGVTPESSSVRVYDCDEINKMGVNSVTDFLRKVPQNFSLVTEESLFNNGGSQAANANLSQGTAVNLNGLGPGATLVLLNGHRLPSSGADGSFVDVSLIPLSAIDRVEILSDGASAVYGADAVAGVVNFVLRDHVDGAETQMNLGTATSGGGRALSLSQALGRTWSSGSALLAYNYADRGPVDASQRNYIQPQDGQFFLIPKQIEQSVLLSGRQDIEDSTKLTSDLSAAQRDYVTDNTSSGGFGFTHTAGSVKQLGVAVGLDFPIVNQFRGRLSGSYGREKQANESDSTFGTYEFAYPTQRDSRLLVFGMQADGDLWAQKGGIAKGSVGVEWRREQFGDSVGGLGSIGTELSRNVSAAFGELLVPIIGTSNAIPAVDRLELSLSARRDRYANFKNKTEPKAGILWSPLIGLRIRSSIGKSYRAPTLAETTQHGSVFSIGPYPDLSSPTGETTTLIANSPQNPLLQPEEAKSFSFGADWQPQNIKGFSISASYFQVQYKNRIATPPQISLLIFDQPSLAPFITRNPSPAQVGALLDSADEVLNSTNVDIPSGIEAIFDSRYHNIASTYQNGVTTDASLTTATKIGNINYFISSNYLIHQLYTTVSGIPSVEILATTFNPARLKLRFGTSWSRGGVFAGLSGNYVSSYHDDLLIPIGQISSWTTADLQMGYTFTSSPHSTVLSGLGLTLNIQNLTDRRPPFVATNIETGLSYLGYDSANASAIGRVVELKLDKRW